MTAVPCRFTGCTSLVNTKSKSGLCKEHIHSTGYCPCPKCAAVNAPPPPVAKPGRRTARVPGYGTYSGNDVAASVTLPAEPWHDAEAVQDEA